MLSADGKMKQNDFSPYIILGELALTGEVRPVKGMLSIALAAKRLGVKSLIVPKRNGPEAAIVDGSTVRAVESLSEAVKLTRIN
jgi:magnesium chelatase family protein